MICFLIIFPFKNFLSEAANGEILSLRFGKFVVLVPKLLFGNALNFSRFVPYSHKFC